MFKRPNDNRFLLGLVDLALAPALAIASVPMKLARRIGMGRLPISRRTLQSVGVMPILDHYYEPMLATQKLNGLDQPRQLPGIDFSPQSQRVLLKSFGDPKLLKTLPRHRVDDIGFYTDNGSYVSADADIWFHMVRHFKPRRIVEIGSGHSTRMARIALALNLADDPAYSFEHICIEPYEAPWLEKSGATIIRQKVENVDRAIFASLGQNDILFIDSSHIIRPQGDVVTEYLEILPLIGPGVIVHVHDIFSPRDYLDRWVREDVLFWNEQYLLEAYLSDNPSVEVLLGVNMMAHDFPELLSSVCPNFRLGDEPGSFYFRRKG